MTGMEEIIGFSKDLIRKLINKKNIYLVSKGNKAIKIISRKFKDKTFLIQDQGGWITYYQYPKKIKRLKTDYGVVDVNDLKKKVNSNSVLLINSLTGYFSEQPMKEIYNICKKKKCLVINDVSGSIGLEISKIGDIILGSFGKWKVIELGYGGFIASNENLNIKEDFKGDYKKLNEQLKNIKKRWKGFDRLNKKVKNNLKEHDIIHKSKRGINVVVRFHNKKEKEEIIKYCESNNYEYTLCPRYIRVNCDAISIELKRKDLNKK